MFPIRATNRAILPVLWRDPETPAGKARHGKRMNGQTVAISGAPWPFFVTLSLEMGHQAGTCRHMSMSIMREGRLPSPAAVWMVAELLGFVDGISACEAAWPEKLPDGGTAINIVQVVDRASGTA